MDAAEVQDSKPRLTQHLMHLNGGNKFSELHYEIRADGAPTGIKRYRRTDGSPKYLVTADIFACGKETFDVIQTRGIGADEWLRAHILRVAEATGEAQS
jgi:hypothetical protein